TDPDSRRIIVSAWNVGELERMRLMPCHAFFQLYVVAGRLSCQLYQRSADVFLGVPFNIASYALLTHLLAQQCDLEPGELIWTGGDCHLYLNHLEQADLQLARTPFALPQLVIRRRPASIFGYQYEDFEFVNYQHHAPIRAPVAV
ncbi:MAG TPA: thymidylate synthase, partial [Steroidobacteraceae bacterium]|nr:thymidylate synthase [Steroidobacteraceae bacterium]